MIVHVVQKVLDDMGEYEHKTVWREQAVKSVTVLSGD